MQSVHSMLTSGTAGGWGDLRTRWMALQASSAPADVLTSLEYFQGMRLEHQLGAVMHLMGMRGALLCDEVGLGKTITAGMLIEEFRNRGMGRVLIVVPSTLLRQWRREMEHCFGSAPEEYRGKGQPPRYAVCSLERVRNPEVLGKLDTAAWDLTVVDEAHRLRNRRTRGFRAVARLRRGYTLLLTATPLHNTVMDLHALVGLARPRLLPPPSVFRDVYLRDRRGLSVVSVEDLRERVRDAMLRRRRRDIPDLFTSRRRAAAVYIDQTEEEERYYRFIRRTVLHRTSGIGAAATYMRMAASSAESMRYVLRKLGVEVDAVPESKSCALMKVLAEADKAVVFTEFIPTQRYILKVLEEHGIPAAAINGALGRERMEAEIERFRRDVDVLVSTDAGSEGINLQFSSCVVNYDLPWNPMKLEQRIGRVHRIGQTRDVRIISLVQRGTIEERVLELLMRKINLFENVIGELDLILGRLCTTRSFEELVLNALAEEDGLRRLERAIDAAGGAEQPEGFSGALEAQLDKTEQWMKVRRALLRRLGAAEVDGAWRLPWALAVRAGREHACTRTAVEAAIKEVLGAPGVYCGTSDEVDCAEMYFLFRVRGARWSEAHCVRVDEGRFRAESVADLPDGSSGGAMPDPSTLELAYRAARTHVEEVYCASGSLECAEEVEEYYSSILDWQRARISRLVQERQELLERHRGKPEDLLRRLRWYGKQIDAMERKLEAMRTRVRIAVEREVQACAGGGPEIYLDAVGYLRPSS